MPHDSARRVRDWRAGLSVRNDGVLLILLAAILTHKKDRGDDEKKKVQLSLLGARLL